MYGSKGYILPMDRQLMINVVEGLKTPQISWAAGLHVRALWLAEHTAVDGLRRMKFILF